MNKSLRAWCRVSDTAAFEFRGIPFNCQTLEDLTPSPGTSGIHYKIRLGDIGPVENCRVLTRSLDVANNVASATLLTDISDTAILDVQLSAAGGVEFAVLDGFSPPGDP